MDKYQAIILIGAARSGTKLLRDLIGQHPKIACVPYDVNYIWRFGQENSVHDQLLPSKLTPNIQKRIEKGLAYFHRGEPYLIEKTVSNCLRIPYIQTVFPQARYIHLVRNGWDVVESAQRQWTAPPDWPYIIRKARSFPIHEAFAYAVKYANTVIRKMLIRKSKTAIETWGPRYLGINEDVRNLSLIEVCALQWQHCIRCALNDLENMPSKQYVTIPYSDFVMKPIDYLRKVADLLHYKQDDFLSYIKTSAITTQNIGKGKQLLSSVDQEKIAHHIDKGHNLLAEHGIFV